MMKPKQYKLGDIFIMRFRGDGNAQHGVRPGVVFQNNTGNEHSPVIVALPLTTSKKKPHMPTHVQLKASETCLPKDSQVLCENPECVPKECIYDYVGTLSEEHMRKIVIASYLASSAASFLSKEDFEDIQRRSVVLNQERRKGCFSVV